MRRRPQLRQFIGRGDLDRTASASNRRALTGRRLVVHVNTAAEIERDSRAADRDAFAQFQIQEPAP